MAEQSTSRGTVMMLVGAVMVVYAIVVMLFTPEPLPAALGVLGVVFIGVGSRKRRNASTR